MLCWGADVTLIGHDTGAFLAINRAVTTTITDCYSLASQTAASHSGLATDLWGGSIKIVRSYNGTGALDTKNNATCTDSYAVTIGGIGAIVIDKEKMQGLAAAKNMVELNSKFVTTDGYPALSLFMDEIDPSVNIVIETLPLSDEANRQLARKAVGEGLVLLKNNNNVLPLRSDNTVAFFGPQQNSAGFYLGGGGSGNVYLNYTPPGPADVFADLAKEGRIGLYEPLYEAYLADTSYVPDTAMYEAAAATADTAIIVIGRRNGEGWDMTASGWNLNTTEKNLLVNATTYFKNVIVLLNCTSSICTDWSVEGNDYGIDADAVLVCHVPGEMGAYGIADVMLGDVNDDGEVDVRDLVSLKKILVKIYNETASSDINGDGTVDALDATELRKILLS